MSVVLGGKQYGSRVRNFHLVYQNHSIVVRSHSQEEALDRFDGFFALTVATLAPSHVFVHAGAVEWLGKAIVIPGKSRAGKSTLVMALVRAGATYLSDEFALLDNSGMIHPFTKPISMRQPNQSRQVDISVESIGGVIGTKPVPLGLVLDTAYMKGKHWQPKQISPGEGILTMLANCPAAQHAPERVLQALNTAAMGAQFFRTPRGDCLAIAPKILESNFYQQTTLSGTQNTASIAEFGNSAA